MLPTTRGRVSIGYSCGAPSWAVARRVPVCSGPAQVRPSLPTHCTAPRNIGNARSAARCFASRRDRGPNRGALPAGATPAVIAPNLRGASRPRQPRPPAPTGRNRAFQALRRLLLHRRSSSPALARVRAHLRSVDRQLPRRARPKLCARRTTSTIRAWKSGCRRRSHSVRCCGKFPAASNRNATSSSSPRPRRDENTPVVGVRRTFTIIRGSYGALRRPSQTPSGPSRPPIADGGRGLRAATPARRAATAATGPASTNVVDIESFRRRLARLQLSHLFSAAQTPSPKTVACGSDFRPTGPAWKSTPFPRRRLLVGRSLPEHPSDTDAQDVESEHRTRHHGHRDRVGGRRQNRRKDEAEQKRVLEVPDQESG